MTQTLKQRLLSLLGTVLDQGVVDTAEIQALKTEMETEVQVYDVISLDRADMALSGFDTRKISDGDLESVSSRIAEYYLSDNGWMKHVDMAGNDFALPMVVFETHFAALRVLLDVIAAGDDSSWAFKAAHCIEILDNIDAEDESYRMNPESSDFRAQLADFLTKLKGITEAGYFKVMNEQEEAISCLSEFIEQTKGF